MAEKKKVGLEEAMSRLEQIVEQMEKEKLPLEKSLKLYEEGIGLISKCTSELESAKRKIQVLQEGRDGGIELVDATDTFIKGRE